MSQEPIEAESDVSVEDNNARNALLLLHSDCTVSFSATFRPLDPHNQEYAQTQELLSPTRVINEPSCTSFKNGHKFGVQCTVFASVHEPAKIYILTNTIFKSAQAFSQHGLMQDNGFFALQLCLVWLSGAADPLPIFYVPDWDIQRVCGLRDNASVWPSRGFLREDVPVPEEVKPYLRERSYKSKQTRNYSFLYPGSILTNRWITPLRSAIDRFRRNQGIRRRKDHDLTHAFLDAVDKAIDWQAGTIDAIGTKVELAEMPAEIATKPLKERESTIQPHHALDESPKMHILRTMYGTANVHKSISFANHVVMQIASASTNEVLTNIVLQPSSSLPNPFRALSNKPSSRPHNKKRPQRTSEEHDPSDQPEEKRQCL